MAAGSYSFEGICVDRARMSVARDGAAISIEPKAMDVLLYLLAHRDRVVTKDELLDAVWTDTFVTPNVLTRAVAQLRKALGDDAQEARIIGTVPKRGYRFIAPVVESASAGPTGISAPPPAAVEPGRSKVATAMLLGVLACVIAVLWLGLGRGSPAFPEEIAASRFTTRLGYDSMPAISPDGRSAVYVSDRTGSLELYLTGLTIGAPDVALTNNGGRNTQPEWSPDGRWIAFRSQRSGGIWIVAAAGGAPQQIVEFGSEPSWAPDSESLVFVSASLSTSSPSALWTVRRDGSERKVLAFSTPVVGAVNVPSWSRNGRYIAFSVNPGSPFREVWVASIDGRNVRRVATRLTGRDVRWAPDDTALLWGGVTDEGLSRLMEQAINPETGELVGEPRAVLPIDGGFVDGLSIARDGQALFAIARTDANLWQVSVRDDAAAEPARLTNDAVRTTYPRVAPDGRISFVQFVDGRLPAAWIMAPDGTNRTPLLPSGTTQCALWSRDGRRVFVLLDGAAHWVDVDTRRLVPVRVEVDIPGGVSLTADDGALLNHRVGADGVMNVWWSPFSGPARQLTFDSEGASYGAASPDGRWIGMQLTRGPDSWIGVMPARPGAPIVPLVRARGQSWLHTWSPDSTRLAFAGERDGVWNIFDVARDTGIVRQLTHWTTREGYVRYPAWDPAGERLIFERSTITSSLWSVQLR